MNVIRPTARLATTMRRAGQGDIAAALGGEILSGARKPGERMPSDADMLKTFGVSRVVTREVIKTLAAKGLVASRMKVGTVVLDPAHWNWLDADVLSWRANTGLDLDFLQHITDVRRAVEPTAAALAALYGTPPTWSSCAKRSRAWRMRKRTGASSPNGTCAFT